MKVKAVIKKVEKALGVKVSHPSGWDGKYCVSYGEHTLSWRSNSTSLHNHLESEASGYHVRRSDDHSDLQTDYFAGSYMKNASQMIHSVKPAPPKFKVGTLVRFKGNKRSKRFGVDGKLGIVMRAGGSGMCQVRLNGGHSHDPLFGQDIFSERDLEIAKSNL
tara:strand:- start:659 stop:1144 length:486 start_codon:yes stop_codon:yes gene_type:complete